MVWAALPSACWHRLIGALLIPSSARLAAQARELGFQLGPTAESATAIDMVDALIKARTGVD